MVNNQHLQLCIYAKLRHAQTKTWPQVAFYIIEEHSILSDTDAYFKDITKCPPNQDGESLATLWDSFEKTWAWRREQLDRGLIELAIEGTEIDANSNPPGGGLKIDKANDRYSDYHALVGFGVEDSE